MQIIVVSRVATWHNRCAVSLLMKNCCFSQKVRSAVIAITGTLAHRRVVGIPLRQKAELSTSLTAPKKREDQALIEPPDAAIGAGRMLGKKMDIACESSPEISALMSLQRKQSSYVREKRICNVVRCLLVELLVKLIELGVGWKFEPWITLSFAVPSSSQLRTRSMSPKNDQLNGVPWRAKCRL